MVTAIVLMKVAQGRVPEVAEALMQLPGVNEVYSVAGTYDLVAIVRVREHEQLADLIAQRLQSVAGITETNTLIAFRAYAQRDLEALWEIGFEEAG